MLNFRTRLCYRPMRSLIYFGNEARIEILDAPLYGTAARRGVGLLWRTPGRGFRLVIQGELG